MKLFRNQTIKKFFNNQNFILWFAIAIMASCVWLYIAKKVHNPKGSEYYLYGVDVIREIKATENLVNKGVMDFGVRDCMFRVPEEHDYSFRMPGFIVLYLPLYVLFGKHTALTLIILIEVLLHALSAYFLGKTALILFKKNWIFHFCFFTYLASSFVFQYNFGFNREGLSTSVLIIAVYLIFSWYVKKKIWKLLFYSILMTWVIFLRPFFLPIFIFFNLLIIFEIRKDSLKRVLKIAILIFLPLLISLFAWTIRNYSLTKKITVLESSWLYFNNYNFENTFQDFNAAIGGNMVYWSSNTSGTWFFPEKMLNEWGVVKPSDDVIPEWIFSDVLTRDTLLKSRDFFWLSLETSDPFQKQVLLIESQIILKKFMSHIKQNYPFKYYVGNNIKSLWNLVYFPQGLSLRGLQYPINVVMTFADNFIKYFVFFIGFLGSFFFLIKIKENYLFWFPLSIIGFLYLFLAFFLQDPENRRIAGAFPFLLIIASGVLLKINTLKFPFKLSIYLVGIILFSILAVNQTINLINW